MDQTNPTPADSPAGIHPEMRRDNLSTTPEPHWVVIERDVEDGNEVPDLYVGPYDTQLQAVFAMDEALLIQGLCEENCLECYTTATPPGDDAEQVIINPTDPDHTGA